MKDNIAEKEVTIQQVTIINHIQGFVAVYLAVYRYRAGHRRGRRGQGPRAPLKFVKIFWGNYHVKFGHFRANSIKIRVF